VRAVHAVPYTLTHTVLNQTKEAHPIENGYLGLLYIVFWAVTLLWSGRYCLQHGTDFVNRPRLFNPVSGRNRPAVAGY
jgi:hypothetical protein